MLKPNLKSNTGTSARVFSILNSQFSISSLLFALYLLALPIYCLLRLSGEQVWQWRLTLTIPTLLSLTGVAHAVETRGWRQALVLFGSGALISLGMEALGAGTGLLFGTYSYTDKLGGKLFGLVPWLIPVAWCSVLYPAWHLPLGKSTWLSRIVLPALAVTAWDLSLDPRMVQDSFWVWPDGGFYFGIPLSNYVGWFVTAALVYLVWHWVDGATPAQILRHPSKRITLLPTLAYIAVWLGESVANAVFWAGPVVGLVVFVGMGVFAWQGLKGLRDNQSHHDCHPRNPSSIT